MRHRLFLTAIVLLFNAVPGPVLSAAQQQSKRIDQSRALRRMMIPGTEDLQLIIELSDPALLERMKDSASIRAAAGSLRPSERNRRVNFASPQALVHRQRIKQAQESLKRRLSEIPGIEIQGTTDTLMNTVLARVPAAQYRAVQRLPGVKKVYFSRPRRLLLDKAAALQNAQNLWAVVGGQANAGRGIKIGIIDSGVDVTNPMFSGEGFSMPPGFPLYSNGSQALTNSKVIVARSYISLLDYRQLDQTADDEVGHGTFVAGCAGGAVVNAPRGQISGMAPAAYIGNYKILGTPGINDSTSTKAELAAIDDAVKDGMDVINLSIGALDYLPPEENAEYIALDKAVKAGVVVTISAGNDGSTTHTIGSPGTIPDVITVGAVTNSREFLAILNTSNPDQSSIGYLPSEDGIKVTADQPFTKIVDVASLDGDGLGCSTFPSKSLSGSVAFVERGICTFETKAANTSRAGAKAVVIYNNVPVGMVSMIGLSSATIPAIMIPMKDGNSLKQYISTHPAEAQVAIKRWNDHQSVSITPRVVSSFSSVGPGTDFSIKPDLVAVGENVYSATETIKPAGTMYDASGFTVSQGTSFSSPMVAGAAAVLQQKFPSLGPLAIKSLLTTTASRDLTIDEINPPNVLQAGSGFMDLSNASAATAVFFPASLNFGVHSYSGSLSLTAALDIENISSSPKQYTLEAEPVVAEPSISFSQSSTGAVAPGASTTINIFLEAAAPATGGFQGFIAVRDTSGSVVYRVPYWAGLYVPDSSRVLRVTQNGSGGGYYSSLSGAIAAAQPGNVIEIADDGVYPSGADGLRISTNAEGLPLHGLTIRSATGRKPVIEAAQNSSGLMVVGIENFLLQGVEIRGGYTGIELYQPSPTLPLSATIDQCIITETSGGSASGIWIDGGGTVDITRSAVKYSSGPGIVAGVFADGTQLTIVGTTIQANQFDGMDAFGANLYISGSTFTGNLGSGLYLERCTGTITGSTIAQNTSYYYEGDGVLIFEGSMTLSDNIVDSNDGVGILSAAESPGPAVKLAGNTVRGNMQCGIIFGSNMSLLADSNFIANNACGVYLDEAADALFLNNIISGSYDSLLGDGIEIAGGTTARLVNDTIYDNARSGVLLTDGVINVENSIVYGNGSGDLLGVGGDSVRSSLISADPKFVNAAQGDFTPGPGSSAIDAGSNAAADLPFLDYYGRLRVSSSNALPGNGRVDIGAVETDSAYPLIYPLSINGPETPMAGVFRTGIAFTNPGSSATQFRFSAYDAGGGYLSGSQNPGGVLLPPQGQLAIFDYELFGFGSGLTSFGSVLGCSNSDSAGFFLMFDEYFRKFSTGANSSQAGTDLVFMRHRSGPAGNTRYAVFNPGIRSVDITATLYDSEGASAGLPQTGTIPPKGSLFLDFDSRELPSGYVRIRSDGPVAGVQIAGDEDLVSVLGAFAPESQARLFFPHFAVGGNYSTEVAVINTSELPANLDISAYDDSGKFIGRVENVIGPGGQFLKTITELFGISTEEPSPRTGYLVVHSTQPGIMGYTNFSYTKGDRRADAFIPADSSPRRRLLFSHVAHGVSAGTGVPYQTGIALLNPFGTDVGFTISVYDGAGNLVGRDSQIVPAHQKTAKILTYPVEGVAFFTQDLVLGNGHVEITTDCGLVGLELFFTEDVSQMAGVPAQTE